MDSPWFRKNWARGSTAHSLPGSVPSRACRAFRQERVRYRKEGSWRHSTSRISMASTRHCRDTQDVSGGWALPPPQPPLPATYGFLQVRVSLSQGSWWEGSQLTSAPASHGPVRRQPVFCKLKGRTGNGPQCAGWGGTGLAGPQPCSFGPLPGSSSATRRPRASSYVGTQPPLSSSVKIRCPRPHLAGGELGLGAVLAWSRRWPGDLRLLLCSMRRWQYSKATSLSRSRGGSRRLAVEAADSTDRVEPSSSDLSSVGKEAAQHDSVAPCSDILSCPCMDGEEGDTQGWPRSSRACLLHLAAFTSHWAQVSS